SLLTPTTAAGAADAVPPRSAGCGVPFFRGGLVVMSLTPPVVRSFICGIVTLGCAPRPLVSVGGAVPCRSLRRVSPKTQSRGLIGRRRRECRARFRRGRPSHVPAPLRRAHDAHREESRRRVRRARQALPAQGP